MIASHDDGEITYYDELGVAPNASAEEIRDAFRLFVRLLHPDQQTDPQLKEIAENQMRKLNRIYAVLSDPGSRRRYDEILDTDFAPPIVLNALNSPSPGLRRFGATLAWVTAIVVSAGLLVWLASDNTPGVFSRAADSSLAGPGATPSPAPARPGKPATDREPAAAQISQLRSDLRAVIEERDTALQELNKLRGNPDNRNRQVTQNGGAGPIEGAEPRPALTMTELPSASKLPVLASSVAPRAERPVNRQLAGFWFYAKPPDGQTNKNQALYPPEFIEATITEEGGVIHGRYRSRFLIVDRAISPDVNFTFTGIQNGSQCNCQWTGAAGARGDLTLKLMSENSLRVDWTASELGTLQGLSSGTAVLTRRIE
jgi:curved DNA-binding protein CbpA